MKSYRLAILRREFSFIDMLFSSEGYASLLPEEVDDIKIKRGDENLLARTPREDSYSWSGGGSYDYSKFFAVVKDGESWVVWELQSEGNSATGSGERHEYVAPTIGEQLFAMELQPDFVVEATQDDTDNNGNGRCVRNWTIYKMRRFDIGAYHQIQIDRAASALKVEIQAAFAD